MKSFNEISKNNIDSAIGKTVKKRLGFDWVGTICFILFVASWLFENQFSALFDSYGWLILFIFACNCGIRIERQKWIEKEEEYRYFNGEYNESTS